MIHGLLGHARRKAHLLYHTVHDQLELNASAGEAGTMLFAIAQVRRTAKVKFTSVPPGPQLPLSWISGLNPLWPEGFSLLPMMQPTRPPSPGTRMVASMLVLPSSVVAKVQIVQ